MTGLVNGRRTNLRALLASIPVAAEDRGSQSETARSIGLIDVALFAETSKTRDVPVYVGFIKAACGVALGLGMSSRALFPDLLASLRRRVSKWPRRRQATASGAGPKS